MLFGLNTHGVPFLGSPLTHAFLSRFAQSEMTEPKDHWTSSRRRLADLCAETKRITENLTCIVPRLNDVTVADMRSASVTRCFTASKVQVTLSSCAKYDADKLACSNLIHPKVTIYPFFPTENYVLGKEIHDIGRLSGQTFDTLLGARGSVQVSFYIPASENILQALMYASCIYAQSPLTNQAKTELHRLVENSTRHTQFIARLYAYVVALGFENDIKRLIVKAHLGAAAKLGIRPVLTRKTCNVIKAHVSFDAYPYEDLEVGTSAPPGWDTDVAFDLNQLYLGQTQSNISGDISDLTFQEFQTSMNRLKSGRATTYVTDTRDDEARRIHDELLIKLKRQFCLVGSNLSDALEIQTVVKWLREHPQHPCKYDAKKNFAGSIDYDAYTFVNDTNGKILEKMLEKPYLTVKTLNLLETREWERRASERTQGSNWIIFSPKESLTPQKGKTGLTYRISMSSDPEGHNVKIMSILSFCCSELIKRHANILPLIYLPELQRACDEMQTPEMIKAKLQAAKNDQNNARVERDACYASLRECEARLERANNAEKSKIRTEIGKLNSRKDTLDARLDALSAKIEELTRNVDNEIAKSQKYARALRIGNILAEACPNADRAKIQRIKYVPADGSLSVDALMISTKFAESVIHPHFTEFLSLVINSNIHGIGVCELFDRSTRGSCSWYVGDQITIYPELSVRKFCHADTGVDAIALQTREVGANQLQYHIYVSEPVDYTVKYRETLSKSLSDLSDGKESTTDAVNVYLGALKNAVSGQTGLQGSHQNVDNLRNHVLAVTRNVQDNIAALRIRATFTSVIRESLFNIIESTKRLLIEVANAARMFTSKIQNIQRACICPRLHEKGQKFDLTVPRAALAVARTISNDQDKTPIVRDRTQRSSVALERYISEVEDFSAHDCAGEAPSNPVVATIMLCAQHEFCFPLELYVDPPYKSGILPEGMASMVVKLHEHSFYFRVLAMQQRIVTEAKDLLERTAKIQPTDDTILDIVAAGDVARSFIDMSRTDIEDWVADVCDGDDLIGNALASNTGRAEELLIEFAGREEKLMADMFNPSHVARAEDILATIATDFEDLKYQMVLALIGDARRATDEEGFCCNSDNCDGVDKGALMRLRCEHFVHTLCVDGPLCPKCHARIPTGKISLLDAASLTIIFASNPFRMFGFEMNADCAKYIGRRLLIQSDLIVDGSRITDSTGLTTDETSQAKSLAKEFGDWAGSTTR